MTMPSRIQIRHWLSYESRDWIAKKLKEYSECAQQDIRHFLNIEQKLYREGVYNEDKKTKKDYWLVTESENSIMSEHEKRKAAIAADIESQKKLYGDDQ